MAGASILRIRGAFCTLGLAALVLSVAADGQKALAVVPAPTGFNLDISPSARLLDALDAKRHGAINASTFYDIVYDETCDNPNNRIQARNRPALMITNWDGIDIGPVASAAPITTLTFEINHTGPYVFGTGDPVSGFTDFIKNTMYTDAGVTITSSSVSADMKTLTVNFDGLTAGKKVVFNIDLDTTDANEFQYPDYRLILCGEPDSETIPATAVALFVNSASPAPNSASQTIQFKQLDETPEWAGVDIRPYHDMDKMEFREMAIPEPSAGVLTLAAVGALALRNRSRRLAA